MTTTLSDENPTPGTIAYYDAIPGFWEAADVVEFWVNAHPGTWHTPSTVARRAKIGGDLVYRILPFLAEQRLITAQGNRSWRRYAARR